MNRIAVTGATGFVGRATLLALRNAYPDCQIRALVRKPDERSLPSVFDSIDVIGGDLSRQPALQLLAEDTDVVVHIAAAIAGNNKADFATANIDGTQQLIAAIGRCAPQAHLVHLSSLAAREPHLSWYAMSKLMAEQVIRASGISHTILRPPAVYGAEDPALADFWRLLARGWMIRLGPKQARFSLLHVDDLVETILRVIQIRPDGALMTLHDGHRESESESGWSWPELASVASEQRGRRIRTVGMPALLLKGIAQLNLQRARMMRSTAMLSPGKVRELIHPDWVCDNADIQEMLNWSPATTLAQRLATLPGWNTAQ